MPGVFVIGEAMLEVSGRSNLAYGGDTINTAVYLARTGTAPAYVTALGNDPLSDEMLAGWEREGIDTRHVLRAPDRLPGLYVIRTEAGGERRFFYWRSKAAVRELFRLPGHEDALAAATEANWLYLTGITLAIFADEERRRLVDLAAAVRAKGGRVAFDPNYRPALWSNVETARRWTLALASHVDIALPTADDEAALFGDGAVEERWRSAGAREVCVKLGPRGCRVAACAGSKDVALMNPSPARDTTGAGDSFNAFYLAARIAGAAPVEAAAAGNRLANVVVQHPGAIIPAEAMP